MGEERQKELFLLELKKVCIPRTIRLVEIYKDKGELLILEV